MYNLTKDKLLIAEDNQLNQLLIKTILDKENIQYDLVENGEKVIEMLEINDYYLILMDIQMPKLDGVETCKHIRNVLKLEIPIVALTANASPYDEQNYHSVGMNGYISKPFSRNELIEKINLHKLSNNS
jgi:CheY-like chemotaxis protein